MSSPPSKGAAEERFAENYLAQQGLSLIERNFLCRLGEIDLIMRHGDVLIFIEVRQRKHARFGSPLETISLAKQVKLKKTAEYYLVKYPPPSNLAMRFDVVGLSGTLPNVQIEWLQNAF